LGARAQGIESRAGDGDVEFLKLKIGQPDFFGCVDNLPGDRPQGPQAIEVRVTSREKSNAVFACPSPMHPSRPPPSNGPANLDVWWLVVESEVLAVLSYPLAEPVRFEALTAGERDIVDGVRRGLTNREIAARRETSVKTVSNQLAHLYRKLGIGSRRQLVAMLGGTRIDAARGRPRES
jgi:DNA-binding CsgD family transcriptional regulator